jgi:tRNA(fMet)-specific endonuclease VapC
VTGYLLDTNIISDLVRHPRGRVAARITEVGEENVCTSIIVAAELTFGALKKRSPKLMSQVGAVLKALNVLPFEPSVDFCYAELRVSLENYGRLIGANDLLIAAHAYALGCTVVTDNLREFRLVNEVVTVNWLDPQ